MRFGDKYTKTLLYSFSLLVKPIQTLLPRCPSRAASAGVLTNANNLNIYVSTSHRLGPQNPQTFFIRQLLRGRDVFSHSPVTRFFFCRIAATTTKGERTQIDYDKFLYDKNLTPKPLFSLRMPFKLKPEDTFCRFCPFLSCFQFSVNIKRISYSFACARQRKHTIHCHYCVLLLVPGLPVCCYLCVISTQRDQSLGSLSK